MSDQAVLPRYLTVREYATAMQLDEGTVRRHCRDGRIPAVRVGDRWRIHPAAAEPQAVRPSVPRRRPGPSGRIARAIRESVAETEAR